MKTHISRRLLAAGLGLAFCVAASAQDSDERKAEKKVMVVHPFSIAAEVSSYEYTEPGAKTDGTMAGFSLQYLAARSSLRARVIYMTSNNLESNIDGYRDRDGYHPPEKRSGEEHRFYDWALAVGGEARLGGNSSVAPYIGIGYRRFLDKTWDLSYHNPERKQECLYWPLGADWKLAPSRNLRLVFNTELDYVSNCGTRVSRYREYDEDAWGDIEDKASTFRHEDGYGIRLSAKVEMDFGRISVFAEPFYRYQNIPRSKAKFVEDSNWEVHPVYFPKNETQEVGMKLGIAF
ncbi:MAG: hypothetical protein LBQ75_09950 [Zoogloeaceae bacterium]|nr:hypothetical protein [Zoogloeaceae bacterium]